MTAASEMTASDLATPWLQRRHARVSVAIVATAQRVEREARATTGGLPWLQWYGVVEAAKL